MVVAIGSVVTVVLGTGIAYAADRYPAQKAVLETVGGFLIIGGLSIIGFALGCPVCDPA
jgi:hypothetical protein